MHNPVQRFGSHPGLAGAEPRRRSVRSPSPWTVLLTVLALAPEGSAAQEYVWRRYGAEAGLASAYALAFDGTGALVVGTNDGLARFDGRTFEPVSLPGITGEAIRALERGPDGAVWGRAERGQLFRLHPSDGRAEAVPPLGPNRWPAQWWHRLRTDGLGRLWTNAAAGALFRYDPRHRTWARFSGVPGERVVDFFVRGDTLVLATADRVGWAVVFEERLGPPTWVFSGVGIHMLRPHPHALAWVGSADGRSGGPDGIVLLGRDGVARRVWGDGAPWLYSEPAVDGRGSLLLVVETEVMRVVRLGPDGRAELVAGPAHGLLDPFPTQFAFDPEGGFWMTSRAGLVALPDEGLRAYPIRDPTGSAEVVRSFAGDPTRGALWAGTWGGVYRLERERFVRVSVPERRAASPLVLDRSGMVWWVEHERGAWTSDGRRTSPLGTRPHLLLDGRTGRLEVATDTSIWLSRMGRRVRLGSVLTEGAVEDAGGRLWIATPGGLDVVLGDSLASRCRACAPASLRQVLAALDGTYLDGVAADSGGRVWMWGYEVGLVAVYRRADGAWALRRFGPEEGLSRGVTAVFPTPDGRLWVGTYSGLFGFRVPPGEPHLGSLAELRVRDGLPGEVVSAVREDAAGRLWVACVPGLVHRIDDWRRFSAPLPSPALRLTALEVRGEAQRSGPPVRLRADDPLALRLTPRSYRQTERLRLEYRLAGRDTAWTSLGSGGRVVGFPQLPAGRYAFEARAVRPGQAPGPVLRQALVVVPPFYRTRKFATLTLLVLAGLLYAGYRARTARVRAHNEQLREEVALQTRALTAANAKLQEVDRLRRDFFANVSHEFRTPLTLILGPLDDLRESLDEEGAGPPSRARAVRTVDVARHNARRLLRLINQLLDIARLEAGAMRLDLRPGDLARLVSAAGQAFVGLAERHRITYRVEGAETPLECRFDADAVEKALSNLLSNAFKFTPERGAIELRLERTTYGGRPAASLSVRDTGPGIPEEEQADVFKRFHRVDESGVGGVGTGIGLALAKELAELHGGEIRLESRPGVGSTFTLLVPIDEVDAGSAVATLSPVAPGIDRDAIDSDPVAGPPVAYSGDGAADSVADEDERPLVLVADDNAQIRDYVRHHLEDVYRVIEAADGAEALAIVREHVPDLVLSDVMMPGIDGLELCRVLKSEPETDFVPVVLLTARASAEDRIQGLRDHADDYLTKPFDTEELVTRVANLIEGRKRLRTRLAEMSRGGTGSEGAASGHGRTVLHPAPIDLPSEDAAFLERVLELVEEHMADDAFGVERLAEEVGMSRVHLFRRLRELCGEAPADMLRRVRLERAAALLVSRAGNVNEVAYAVGFRSVSSFCRAFRAVYDMSPSAYALRAAV